MKKLLTIIPLAILLCFSVSCQQAEEVAEEPAVDLEAEREAVRVADIGWSNAFREKNVDAIPTFLADDCVITGANMFRDKAWYREYWTDQFSQEGAETSWITDEVTLADSGDLAYTLSTAEHVRIVEGESRKSKQTFFAVWKKQADGSWKVIAGF